MELTIDAGEEYQVSPTLLVALARTTSNENVQLYLDRHGIAGLATAVEYARDYVREETNARLMAGDLDIPVMEAETMLQELREIILDVEPDIEAEFDLEELDAAVADRSTE